jgi:NitT/TauT family transport system substrate-binding protein
LSASIVHAEGTLRVAQQFGIAYLLLDVARDQQLIEKHGKAAGVDITVEWRQISGAAAMNEALLAGALDVVTAGTPPMLNLWDRTHSRQNIKGIAALGSIPSYLLTNNPRIQSLDDFTEKDRIAVPSAIVGFQPRTLQIEAAKRYGNDQYKRFDAITISLPHPDATAALLSGGSEISAHFSSAPFQYQALENPNVRKLLSSYDVLGGPGTMNVLYTTEKFHTNNPKTYRAFYQALEEAEAFVKANPDEATEIYIRQQNSRLDRACIKRITPERTFVYAQKMRELGILKVEPNDWKDYFFPAVHARPGS